MIIYTPSVCSSSRLIAPSTSDRRPYGDVDVASGRPLRRVETALPAGSPVDGAAERGLVDRPASDGESDDGGGRPRPLQRWPDVGREQDAAGRRDDTDTEETSDEDDDQPSGNNNNRSHAPVTTRASSSLHSTSTATPNESRADSSILLHSDSGGRTIITRATVI